MTMNSRRSMLLPVTLLGAVLWSLSASSFAQGPGAGPAGPGGQKQIIPPMHDAGAGKTGKPDYDEFNLSTSIGSFKMLEFNDDNQPEGHLELSFTGTVLIDSTEAVKHSRGLTTTVKTEGSVIREKAYHGRWVYHGKGKIIVDGGWHALQWFGQDMTAKFYGSSVFRLSGEFDKNLETGFYWYKDGKKNDWGTGGTQPTVPSGAFGAQKAKVRINGKGG